MPSLKSLLTLTLIAGASLANASALLPRRNTPASVPQPLSTGSPSLSQNGTAAAGNSTANFPGSADCNAARVAIVQALSLTDIDVSQIQSKQVKKAAKAGVKEAAKGINSIVDALQKGEAAPAKGRQVTIDGLNKVQAALEGGDVSDPAVVLAVERLVEAGQAGDQVLALC
ncbi:hypothetical protein EJ04DRAFT_579853 [Polyplosphaeria fusca]|uniref:Uncharacterized protein n=1 Tax=Polyplosphaeria fusca TaxID=682080 RepID=A0A9P4UXK8_9PLEO|nr:hypothetical protein EJ04DRAFT_579853 [Polyplosphaeria fusca]